MRFLTTLLWIALLLIAGIFAYRNWTPIEISLWNNRVMDTYLPIPIILAFLLGMLPPFIAYRTTRWSLRRKLANSEAVIASSRPTYSASGDANKDEGSHI